MDPHEISPALCRMARGPLQFVLQWQIPTFLPYSDLLARAHLHILSIHCHLGLWNIKPAQTNGTTLSKHSRFMLVCSMC